MSPNEAVVAGSPEFVDAVLPLFTERLGGAPRVAETPHLASALCQDGARLLVYEHGGREWLTLCTDLRGITGLDLAVIVALPPEHAGDVAVISATASAVVAWRGQAKPVLEAASRVLAARDAPASPPRRTGPVLTPQPAMVALRPATTPAPTPVPTPPHRAVATAPPRPVMTAAPRLAAPVPDLFDSFFGEEAVADAATPGAAMSDSPPPPSTQAPTSLPAPFAVWPGTVLSAADGQAVMRAALSGRWPELSMRPVTEKLAASLSTAEKGATLGQKLPFDPVPVRRAVGLRWQVAAALDTLPSQAAKVDQEAVQAILGGIDDVLADLKALSDDASPEALRALETIRHALVKEAIDLTEALQQVAPPEMVEEITTSRKARKAAAPVTRMVYTAAAGPDRRPSQMPWGLVTVLVVAVAAAAAYHGYRYVNRPNQAASTISGAPSGTVGTVTPKGKVIVAPAGVKLDPKEVENFKHLEKAKGSEVREVVPGTLIVTPARAKPDSSTGESGKSAQGAKP